jgi:hypothetical protein
MESTQARWQLTGDFFENCNCEVLCPCLISSGPFLSGRPTNGFCEVAAAFHVDQGRYGDVALDGLNVVTILRSPGPIADGNLSIAVYLDERADERQSEALQTIFAGAAGGPMGGLAPLISSVLGTKTRPITFRKEGKRRAVEIPGVMQMAVHAAPGADSQKEISLINVHPFAPEA